MQQPHAGGGHFLAAPNIFSLNQDRPFNKQADGGQLMPSINLEAHIIPSLATTIYEKCLFRQD